jgi:hypothetical protein
MIVHVIKSNHKWTCNAAKLHNVEVVVYQELEYVGLVINTPLETLVDNLINEIFI